MTEKINVSTLTETQLKMRADREIRRGIVRDDNGVIIRDKDWYAKRKIHLEEKKEDLLKRISNIDNELAHIESKL